MAGALDDIKVVDLTRTLAGPFCTMLLGDMGADVVKIEEPSLGDEIRHWTPFWNGESTQFVTFNRNKRSITVNLKEPEGVDLVRGLAADADVMIESFRAGTLERMGLGYDEISAINPGVVYCSISGYGRTGPMANMPGYDLIIQAYSGLMHLTGEPDGLPQRVGFSLVDLFTGMMAYGTVVTALRQRDQTGKGQWVEAALLDGQPPPDLSSLIRPALFVPEMQRVDLLLRELRARNTHMAIVVNEHGETEGLVTIEDLLEEIVGEIEDEFDSPEVQIEPMGAGVIETDASVLITDVNEALGLELAADDVDTIGGLVYNTMGAVPNPGDAVAVDGAALEVLTTKANRILRVRVRKLPVEPAHGG